MACVENISLNSTFCMNYCDGMTIASYDKKVFEADIGLKYHNTKYINEYGKYQKLFMYEPHITGAREHLMLA